MPSITSFCGAVVDDATKSRFAMSNYSVPYSVLCKGLAIPRDHSCTFSGHILLSQDSVSPLSPTCPLLDEDQDKLILTTFRSTAVMR